MTKPSWWRVSHMVGVAATSATFAFAFGAAPALAQENTTAQSPAAFEAVAEPEAAQPEAVSAPAQAPVVGTTVADNDAAVLTTGTDTTTGGKDAGTKDVTGGDATNKSDDANKGTVDGTVTDDANKPGDTGEDDEESGEADKGDAEKPGTGDKEDKDDAEKPGAGDEDTPVTPDPDEPATPEEGQPNPENPANPADGKWVKQNGSWYWYKDGKKATSQMVTVGKKSYWVDGQGRLVTSKMVKDDKTGERYWFDANGVMAADKEAYDPESKAWYWFDADGTMAVDKDVFIPSNGGKWVRYDKNGGMIKGEDYRLSSTDNKYHWWYFDPTTGEMLKSFVNVADGTAKGKWVYYDDVMGWMVYGEQYRPSSKTDTAYHWYYFDEFTGATTYGFKHLGSASKGKWVYYDDVMGWMLYGQQYKRSNATDPDYHWYYFDDHTGATTYGFKYLNDNGGKWVYYQPVSGWMAYKWHNINGTWNYFDKVTGARRAESNAAYAAWNAIQNKTSSSRYYITIDNSNYRTVVFEGSAGNWEPLYDWSCAVGRLPRPGGDQTYGITARGEFKVLKKGYIMGQCPYEFYWTEFFNNGADPTGEGQRFHSILYWDQNHNSLYEDGRGGANTHGCVRLGLDQAKWIYDNVPIGTGVYSYA